MWTQTFDRLYFSKAIHLACTFIYALHTFDGIIRPRLDILRLYDLAEGPLTLFGNKTVLGGRTHALFKFPKETKNG
jgi:hypothetical protein